jgi:hypothetical protein
MSRRPIALSLDLLRLQNEGYDLDIRGGYLLVRDVPFVNAQRAVGRGILISKLKLSGDIAEKPDDHVCYWTGEHPCHADGSKITSRHISFDEGDVGANDASSRGSIARAGTTGFATHVRRADVAGRR